MSFEAMADDVVEVVDHLAVGKADVVGYSLGGLVAMAFATRHLKRVRKLVVVSAPVNRHGWLIEHTTGMDAMNASIAEQMKQTPMYEMYQRVAPVVEDWPRLVDAMGKLMRTPFDFSATVWPTTMLAIGDADGMKLTSMVEFFALLGGGLRDAGWDGKARPASQMAMLPNRTHYDMFSAPELVETVERFLG
jgi:pimeloyl-ACP methyl ester carboxylesterase